MPDLTGTFSHPDAGRLRVVFNARFLLDGAEPGAGPYADDIFVRAYVGTDGAQFSSMLHFGVASAVYEDDYAGGYELVPVGLALYFVRSVSVVPMVMCARDLSISCHLMPV